MKLNRLSILLLLSAFLMQSCDLFLEPDNDGSLTEDDIWGIENTAFGFMNTAYQNIPAGYNRISNAMLSSGTDESVHSDLTSTIKAFNDGTWSPYLLVENVWSKNYTGIRRVNLFLENIDDLNLESSESLQLTRERMKGEARFLRALFYFELVKRYGGVPLILNSLTTEEATMVTRATVDECMEQIILDCDSAYYRLPTAYPEGRTAVAGYDDSGEKGRATKGATLALKAKAYLYWASPLFDPQQEHPERYEQAAQAAQAVISTGLYRVSTFASGETYTNLYANLNTTNYGQYHKELVFSTSYTTNNTTVEQYNSPVSMGGYGYTNPTQNLVDAFGMANGLPIDDPDSGYDPANPYEGRDPRFYEMVVCNGQEFSMNDKVQTIETYVGGRDAYGAYSTSTRTGYYLTKLLSSTAVWDGWSSTVNRTWMILGYPDILLTYAEAVNECSAAPTDSVFTVLEVLRARAGLDPYLIDRGTTKEEMREIIRNERQVELCFEEHRFFDVRRWRLMDNEEDAEKYLTIRGMEITQNEQTGELTYTPYVVETREWDERMYLYPIPQTEMLTAPGLTQNPGW